MRGRYALDRFHRRTPQCYYIITNSYCKLALFTNFFVQVAEGGVLLRAGDHGCTHNLEGNRPFPLDKRRALVYNHKNENGFHFRFRIYKASLSGLEPTRLISDTSCAHLPSNKLSMDFVGASRRKVRTFQGEQRQKTREFIAERLARSSPLRLRTRIKRSYHDKKHECRGGCPR